MGLLCQHQLPVTLECRVLPTQLERKARAWGTISLSPIFRLCCGLIFASVLWSVSACPSNIACSFVSVPVPDQTREIPKSCMARGTEASPRGGIAEEGAASRPQEAAGSPPCPDGLWMLPQAVTSNISQRGCVGHPWQSPTGEGGVLVARTVPGTQQLLCCRQVNE